MKRTLITLSLIVAGSMSGMSAAHADWYSWNARWNAHEDIDARRHDQLSRIERGVRDGSLTRHEARELIAEQHRIAEVERRAKADGHVDFVERARLKALQDEASRHISAERHDSETAYRPWYRRWY